jgi:hypothetical protein
LNSLSPEIILIGRTSTAGRRPDLLAVDHPLVAVELGLAAEVAEVGAGVGLAVALAPQVLTREDARQEVALLLLGTPLDDRVADHLDAEHVVGPTAWDAGLLELLGQDHVFERREVRAAVLLGPGDTEVVVLVQRAAPVLGELVGGVVVEGTDPLPVRRQVLGQEGLHLLPVHLGLGRIMHVHTSRLLGAT